MGVTTRRAFIFCVFLSIVTLAALDSDAQGGDVWLVTSQEAALRPSPDTLFEVTIDRGPDIRQISPVGEVSANQPFDLHVAFGRRSGKAVNPATARVNLLRGNNIDITDRLNPFITADGIEMPAAMVPRGVYVLQVAVSDAAGRHSLGNIKIDAR